jgi:hypothetical protein
MGAAHTAHNATLLCHFVTPLLNGMDFALLGQKEKQNQERRKP